VATDGNTVVVMLRTVARRVGALLSVGMSALSAASAQSGRGAAEVTRTPGGTVSVRLLVRPRVGDTLRLQMEQTIEVSRRTAARCRAGAPVIDGTRTSPRTRARAVRWTTDREPCRGQHHATAAVCAFARRGE
jgi:hypothetical protein